MQTAAVQLCQPIEASQVQFPQCGIATVQHLQFLGNSGQIGNRIPCTVQLHQIREVRKPRQVGNAAVRNVQLCYRFLLGNLQHAVPVFVQRLQHIGTKHIVRKMLCINGNSIFFHDCGNPCERYRPAGIIGIDLILVAYLLRAVVHCQHILRTGGILPHIRLHL